MYYSVINRLRDVAGPLLVFAGLCFGSLCQASPTSNLDQSLNISRAAAGIEEFGSVDIAVVATFAIAGLLIIVWVVRRSIRRSRLSSLRAQRHGTSGLDGTAAAGKLRAKSRPEKTTVIRSIVIGSEHDVDVRFDNEGVSTRHAELLVLRQVDSSPLMPLEPIYYIRDMASTRGIQVLRDGDWIPFQADVVLDDERLRIGDIECTAAEINRLAIQSRLEQDAPEVEH